MQFSGNFVQSFPWGTPCSRMEVLGSLLGINIKTFGNFSSIIFTSLLIFIISHVL